MQAFNRIKLVAVSAILCSAMTLLCQNAPVRSLESSGSAESSYIPHMAFDVASIRESGDGNGSYIDNMAKASVYEAERVKAVGLIMGAYDVHLFPLVENLPQWAQTTPYTVSAKSDDATDAKLAKLSDKNDYAEKRHMLQGLLAERFKLRIHSETRISKTYELVATERAAKLMTPMQGDAGKGWGTCNMQPSSKGVEVVSKGCPFSILLSNLEQMMGTSVLDHTGMSGMYAYHLMWDPRPVTPGNDEERYPQLVDAVREQLGLELKKTQGPVMFWVVDHIERPTAN